MFDFLSNLHILNSSDPVNMNYRRNNLKGITEGSSANVFDNLSAW